jgi:formate hydrogenlyase subunit 4
MSGKAIIEILGALANVVIVLIVAPFFEGVLRKLTARIQSRQGPPLWQPYYDLLKISNRANRRPCNGSRCTCRSRRP